MYGVHGKDGIDEIDEIGGIDGINGIDKKTLFKHADLINIDHIYITKKDLNNNVSRTNLGCPL